MKTTSERFDVAIIGAGTAGLAAMREVRRTTENFVLINDGPFGTTCARVGCMPSKALIAVAKTFHQRNFLATAGIAGTESLKADLRAVLRHVRKLRDAYVGGVLKITDEVGERVIAGRARFVQPDTLEVGDRQLRARHIIIATGSRPIVPQPWQALGERVLTSDTLFEQETLPGRIAVVGLGALGVEMAQALTRLGITVTGFDAAERAAGLSDPVVSARAFDILSGEFPLHLGQPAELSQKGDGAIQISAGSTRVVVDAVIASLGRGLNLDGLGLKEIGVALDEHGLPPFDPGTLRIAGVDISIAGDVNGMRPLLHEAADEGYIAGYNALRDTPECFARRVPLGIVFCDPNITMVGQRFKDLDQDQVVVGEVDLKGQGRLRMEGADRGLIRLYADIRRGSLLGVELCCPHGEHLAHLLALAIQQGLTVRELLRMPFYHPVVEEGLRSALRDAAGKLSDDPTPDLSRCGRLGAEALE